MTANLITTPHSRGMMRPSYARILRPKRAWALPQGEAGNAGCPLHPQPRARSVVSTRVSHHEFTGITRHSRTRMVLTVSFVLSPVIGLCCHRRLADTSARLDANH